MTASLNLFTEIGVSLLIVLASLFTLIGSIGIVKLNDVFERIHAPAILSTASNWCFVVATAWYFSVANEHFMLKTILIGMFISISNPISTIFMMRAAIFRRSMAVTSDNLEKDKES